MYMHMMMIFLYHLIDIGAPHSLHFMPMVLFAHLYFIFHMAKSNLNLNLFFDRQQNHVLTNAIKRGWTQRIQVVYTEPQASFLLGLLIW